jgi:hypothetical protein
VEARRAVDAVAIEQRHRRVAERRSALDERLGHGSAAEETEGRRGMKIDAHKIWRSGELVIW